MKILKKILGFIIMLSSPVIVVFMLTQANYRISKIADSMVRMNSILQWSIILIVFIPVCIGFAIFGYYGLKGEYDDA